MANALLGTRFHAVAENTIDYWMKPDQTRLTQSSVMEQIEQAPWLPRSTLQLYLHVAYCAQKCSFCAFSGGNSIDFKTARKYADLLIWQMTHFLSRTQAFGKPIASVNIGGGSPDLIKGQMARVLDAVRNLPGFHAGTEISVEFALSTVNDEFLDILGDYQVTKASFGIQTLDPKLRVGLRMPEAPRRMEEICERLSGKVPIVNVDLITGFPTQTLSSVIQDLDFFISHPIVNSVSTYLLTPGAAPQLIADIETGRLSQRPPENLQAQFRLNSYALLQQEGWVRKGTNTYMAPHKISNESLTKIAGNECIGARRYGDFLIGCGAQAVSSLPGLRVENTADTAQWVSSAEKQVHSVALEKCTSAHQRDMALWTFPLAAEGLLKSEYEEMVTSGALDASQIETFNTYRDEALILERGNAYRLSILGEVMMGQLVKDFKKKPDQEVLKDYIAEGYALGLKIAKNEIAPSNSVNNRQLTRALMGTGDA